MFIILFHWAFSVTGNIAEPCSWFLYFVGVDSTPFSRYFSKHFLKISFLSCLNISVPMDFIFGPQFCSVLCSPWVISAILLVWTLIVCSWIPNLPQASKVGLNIQLPVFGSWHCTFPWFGSSSSSRQRHPPFRLWSASWAASAWQSASWTAPRCRPAACHQTVSQ